MPKAAHGLKPNPTVLFEDNPREYSRYESRKNELFEQILPDGELERVTFERYVYAVHQSERMRQHELEAQARWTNEPDHPHWFTQMERIQKLVTSMERRADKALAELRKLQRDRIAALEVANELYVMDEKTIIPIPATLPVAEMRKSDFTKTNPFFMATMLLSTNPKIKAILNREAEPEPIDIPADLLSQLDLSSEPAPRKTR
ncbi:MAG: hypothetical protein FJW36_05855 [Acidobacteria bacterium]|nr:hypothetical protein [Acidobacteriota bacterium]